MHVYIYIYIHIYIDYIYNSYVVNDRHYLWHAKMILIQLTKYHATFKILFNFVKYMVQLSKYSATLRNISYNSGRMYIFWEHVK